MSLRDDLYIGDSKINFLLQQVDPGFGRKRTSVYSGGGAERTVVGLGGSGGHLLGASGAGEQHEVFASSTVNGLATAQAAPGRALAAVHLSLALGG